MEAIILTNVGRHKGDKIMNYMLKNQLFNLTMEEVINENHTSYEAEKIKQTYDAVLKLFSIFSKTEEAIVFEDVDFIENRLANFPKFLVENYGFSKSNAHEYKRRVRKVRDIFTKHMVLKQGEKIEFSVVLASCVNQDKLERSKIAEKLKIPTATFNRWFLGEKYPRDRNLKKVEKVEQYFKLEKGFLVKRLENVLFGQKTNIIENRNRTELGNIIKTLTQLTFSLPRVKWPKKIEDEFNYLANFYLIEDIDESEYQDMLRHSSMRWGTTENPTGTYKQFQRLCECYLGFLVLPKNKNKMISGLGMQLEEISLFHLVDYSLLKKFFNFSKLRRGEWTTGISTMAKRVQALLNPKYGILTQSSHHGEMFLSNYGYDESSWDKFCSKTLEQVKNFLATNKFESLSDPFERVLDILDSEDPYVLIKDALDKGKRDIFLPGLPNNRVAQRYRDFLIFFFHILFGFRSEHFSNLKIGEQLIKNNGKWELCIYKKDLKRKFILKQRRTTIQLPIEVSDLIEVYVNEYRPMLCSKNSDYFFNASKNSTGNRTEKLRSTRVSRVFKEFSELYLESEYGISSHDTRKIIATISHFVSCDKFFEKGSTVLLHDVATHKKHYTINEVKNAFKFHFQILEENGLINKRVEQEELSRIQLLEKEKYELEEKLRITQELVESKKYLQVV